MMPKDESNRDDSIVVFLEYKNDELFGELKSNREKSDSNSVNITSKARFNTIDGAPLFGDSRLGKVSLLGCSSRGVPSTINQEGQTTIYHKNVFFDYILIGSRHVKLDNECIKGIRFTLRDIKNGVFNNDQFKNHGFLDQPADEIVKIINKHKPDSYPELQRGKGLITYFSGDWDYLQKFKTIHGDVSIKRWIMVDLVGTNLNSEPYITVDFDKNPAKLEDALDKMRKIRLFFAWIMGYLPELGDVFVYTTPQNDDGKRDESGKLQVYSGVEYQGTPEGKKESGSLIDATHFPDEFKKVIIKWLKRHEKREEANNRFLTYLSKKSFKGSQGLLEDYVKSAGDTFDLLPDQDKPPANSLPSNVCDILDEAKKQIKECYKCREIDEKTWQDISSTLGHIKKNRRLSDTIKKRAEIVIDHYGEDKLKELNMVIGKAVKCRNRFTHRSKNESDQYNYDIEAIRFLAETLEFIYGTSELLECGWKTGISTHGCEIHHFDSFMNTYDRRKSLLG